MVNAEKNLQTKIKGGDDEKFNTKTRLLLSWLHVLYWKGSHLTQGYNRSQIIYPDWGSWKEMFLSNQDPTGTRYCDIEY
jgi:hypothetical protein